jgi:hypothetical protein
MHETLKGCTMTNWLRRLHEDESGHNAPFGAMLLGVAAAVALTWGVVGDIDWLTIVGGVALGLGMLATTSLTHMEVDYNVFQRLEALEGDRSGDD